MQGLATELLTKGFFLIAFSYSRPFLAPPQMIQDVIHRNKQYKEKQM